jgi:hypothetical protein
VIWRPGEHQAGVAIGCPRRFCGRDTRDGFRVGRKLQETVNTWIRIKELHLRLGPTIERD